jgi:hypothetical protein
VHQSDQAAAPWRLTPPLLFHYTSAQGVIGIADSRVLRASCVADFADKTEIKYGVEILKDEVKRALRLGVPLVSEMVLARLAEQAVSRIHRTFAVCFCSDGSSLFHWRRYGNYCLQFETNGRSEPLVRPTSWYAQAQYHRVIYGRFRQRAAIRSAIQAIVAALNRNGSGTSDGPSAEYISVFLARNTSALLLDLLTAFKKLRYYPEQEWRLTVRPNLSLCSSAPDLADKNFDVTVKQLPRRFVELHIVRETRLFEPLLRRPVPFNAVIQSPFARNAHERVSIQKALDENCGPEIQLRAAGWPLVCGLDR